MLRMTPVRATDSQIDTPVGAETVDTAIFIGNVRACTKALGRGIIKGTKKSGNHAVRSALAQNDQDQTNQHRKTEPTSSGWVPASGRNVEKQTK